MGIAGLHNPKRSTREAKRIDPRKSRTLWNSNGTTFSGDITACSIIFQAGEVVDPLSFSVPLGTDLEASFTWLTTLSRWRINSTCPRKPLYLFSIRGYTRPRWEGKERSEIKFKSERSIFPRARWGSSSSAPLGQGLRPNLHSSVRTSDLSIRLSPIYLFPARLAPYALSPSISDPPRAILLRATCN